MRHGFRHWVAVMDWYSRLVLSGELANSLDTSCCLIARERALAIGRPNILNSDPGSQFTRLGFTGRLDAASIRMSMDGRGRVFDNMFIERRWRSAKNEKVYLPDYTSGPALMNGLQANFDFYNRERLHQALNYRTAETVDRGSGREMAPALTPVALRPPSVTALCLELARRY